MFYRLFWFGVYVSWVCAWVYQQRILPASVTSLYDDVKHATTNRANNSKMKRRENNNCAASAIKHTTTEIYMLSTNTCTQITMAKKKNGGDGHEERERPRQREHNDIHIHACDIQVKRQPHYTKSNYLFFSYVLVASASASLRRLEKLTMTAENCTEDVVSYIYTQQMCNVLMVWLRVRAYVNEWRRMTKRKCPLFFRK